MVLQIFGFMGVMFLWVFWFFRFYGLMRWFDLGLILNNECIGFYLVYGLKLNFKDFVYKLQWFVLVKIMRKKLEVDIDCYLNRFDFE